MPRSTALPSIPVKTQLVTKRLQISTELNSAIDDFCSFYEQQKGAKPEANAAIVALVEDALNRNRDFQRFRKTAGAATGAKSGTKHRATADATA